MKALSHSYVIPVIKSFDKDSKLKLHIKGMQGRKKPFLCAMCGSQFYFTTKLYDHIETNHESQDITVSKGLKEHPHWSKNSLLAIPFKNP